MANLNQIANTLMTIRGRYLAMEPARCVKVRHRAAACDRCIDACPRDAIHIANNTIVVTEELCINCGACTSVCPTLALRSTSDYVEQAIGQMDQFAEQGRTSETIAFSCGKAKAHLRDIPTIEVPCLAHLDESVYTHAARLGFSQVILIEEREDSCSQQQHDVIADIAFSAMDHLRAWGNDLDIDQIDVAPDGSAEEEELPVEADEGSSRRGFFKGLLDKTNETIANTAAVTLETYEQANQPRQTLSQTLMNEDGSMRTFPNDRNDRMMDDLYEIGEPVCDRLRSQRFGEVHVDTDKCQLCGLCARFCTSGALQGEASVRASAWGRRVDERKGYLTFRSNDCMQCHLCEAACFHEALSVSDEVNPHQLFEFEPVQLA